jgi:hypothetical protein
MTETLKQVLARVERLPAEQQDAIAEVIERELEEREWEELVGSPASQRFLEALADEARAEDAAGQTRPTADYR